MNEHGCGWYAVLTGALALAMLSGCGDDEASGGGGAGDGGNGGGETGTGTGTDTGIYTLICDGDSAEDCACHASDQFGDGTTSNMQCGSEAAYCCASSDWPATGDCDCSPAATWACTAFGTGENSSCDCRWYDEYDELPDDAIDPAECNGQNDWETCCLDEAGDECSCYDWDINDYGCPTIETAVASCDKPYAPSDDECSPDEVPVPMCNGT